MACVTPSNPDPIPFGESLDIDSTLAQTGGSLSIGGPVDVAVAVGDRPLTRDEVQGEQHRVAQLQFLQAQTAASAQEVKRLWDSVQVEHRQKAGVVTSPSAASVRRVTGSRIASRKAAASPRRRIDDDYDVALMANLFNRAETSGGPLPRRDPSVPTDYAAEETELDEQHLFDSGEDGDNFDLTIHRPISRMQL